MPRRRLRDEQRRQRQDPAATRRSSNVFIQPAAGDNGTALGAALEAWHASGDRADRPAHGAFVLGHRIRRRRDRRRDSRQRRRRAGPLLRGRTLDDEAALCQETAALLAAGNIVGWFQGRMEWGARALGNRSILADPRRRDMRDVINQKIKFRERFRPFAPSVLAEAIDEYFVDAVHDPFMIQVYPVRPDKRDVIPAVTHVDGSGRLQSVSQESNARYWALIRAFQARDRRAGPAEHLVQRERTDRRAAGAGARLLPAHRHGRARHGPAPAAQAAVMTRRAAPPLRVCYFNRSYWPDTGATGQLLTELAEDLVAMHGIEVTVVTGYPRRRPARRLPSRETRNGVRIMRARGTTLSAATVRRARD